MIMSKFPILGRFQGVLHGTVRDQVWRWRVSQHAASILDSRVDPWSKVKVG